MSIKLNTKPTDITVYDKVNIKHATDNEVVNLVNVIKGNFNTELINIISCSLKLTDAERQLYYHISSMVNANAEVVELILRSNYTKAYIRSTTTYIRCITTLLVKGVVSYKDNGSIVVLNDAYNVNVHKDFAKYIVVEVVRG